MVSKSASALLLLLATLCSCYPGQNKVNIVGQWVISSVLNYDTNIQMRFDGDDIHFKYGTMNQKVLVYTKSGQNSMRFTPRATTRNANNEKNPNEIQIDNAFATVSTYQLVDQDNDDMQLKDAFGRTLVTLVKADAYKARNKVRNMIKSPQQQLQLDQRQMRQQRQVREERQPRGRRQDDFYNPRRSQSPPSGQIFCPHCKKYHN